MILSPYERELIVRSVASDRRREAEEIRGRSRAKVQLPSTGRRSTAGMLRQTIGMSLIRMGARIAGLNARLVPEWK